MEWKHGIMASKRILLLGTEIVQNDINIRGKYFRRKKKPHLFCQKSKDSIDCRTFQCNKMLQSYTSYCIHTRTPKLLEGKNKNHPHEFSL